MRPHLTLISHKLCPYVQRAAIVLAEKGISFERKDIDLANKPDWFLKLSPLGKTPLLLVDGEAVFESTVICEYLDDTAAPRLHPQDALQRARHRGWMEFGSAVLNNIGAFYNAPDEQALAARAAELRAKVQQIEAALGAGPYFAGSHFSMVDAAFGPVFRYFDVFDTIGDFGVFADMPKVNAWRQALAQRDSVRTAVGADYPELLSTFLQQRRSALSGRMAAVLAV
ncbi:MAG: glutathione S-transferase family protein [Pseudomonadota bacterium]|uniref:glutathione S-transferase family protein n=1 Tax=Polaromonas sp. TaxID=1869339 RepID=UPI0017961F32|nr:glutathione S-transferase family protein [Polaromonas sp.]MBA3592563.1 glutathione S-transferase family protein [Polaromonas sp.]MDQ3272070.1 glutathione S-transferase family protein [Pseudomonadota bacterium]